MKKVLHVLSSNCYSGAENVVISIIKNYSNYKGIYLSPKGEIESFCEEEGIQHVHVEKMNLENLRRVIKNINPDIIHAHDFKASLLCAILKKKHIPLISHLHNNPPWIKKINLKSVVYLMSLKRYNKILMVSEAIKKEFVFNNMFGTKGIVVGNPIDVSAILRKEKYANLFDRTDIMFLGRITEQKNPLLFLDIVKEIVKYHPKIKVGIVGNGDLFDKLSKRIIENGLENNVRLYGFQRNPYGMLKNTKILCLPSKWEGFGLVAIEALSFGKPVICSSVGGLLKVVNDSCGAICNKKEEYIYEIKNLLENERIYNLKSQNAYKRAEYLSNILEYISNLENVYEQINKNYKL